MPDPPTKDQPQLVNVKRIDSLYNQNSSNNIPPLQDDHMITSSPPPPPRTIEKHGSQSSLHTSISNIFKVTI